MIWDFRGPDAQRIAEHHAIHLKEFVKAEGLENVLVDTEEHTAMHHMAFMIIDEHLVDDLRKRLKPNRGQRYVN